jgi:hypothetical protein
MSFTSLITFTIENKYFGALHLLGYNTNAFLQISVGSAAFNYPGVFYKYLTVPITKGFLY